MKKGKRRGQKLKVKDTGRLDRLRRCSIFTILESELELLSFHEICRGHLKLSNEPKNVQIGVRLTPQKSNLLRHTKSARTVMLLVPTARPVMVPTGAGSGRDITKIASFDDYRGRFTS